MRKGTAGSSEKLMKAVLFTIEINEKKNNDYKNFTKKYNIIQSI